MTTNLLILVTVLFLLIIGIALKKAISNASKRHLELKLRKWCIEQASSSNIKDYVNEDTGVQYLSESGALSIARKYYEFITPKEHLSNSESCTSSISLKENGSSESGLGNLNQNPVSFDQALK